MVLWVLVAIATLVVLVLVVSIVVEVHRTHKQERLNREVIRMAQRLDRLDGFQFEEFITRWLQARGWKARNIPDRGDYGADIIAKDPEGRTWVVQCKRYAAHRKVGVDDILKTAGAQRYYQTDRAVIITTGQVTRQARETAKKLGVDVVDGETLQAHLFRTGFY